MHLTCIGAAERPHTDVRAGQNEASVATSGTATMTSGYPGPAAIPGGGARRDEGETGLSPRHLTCLDAVERVQRLLLHPGPQC